MTSCKKTLKVVTVNNAWDSNHVFIRVKGEVYKSLCTQFHTIMENETDRNCLTMPHFDDGVSTLFPDGIFELLDILACPHGSCRNCGEFTWITKHNNTPLIQPMPVTLNLQGSFF